MISYQYDCSLPRLPIPSLEETVSELRLRSRPLLSDPVYDAFCRALEQFSGPEGEGPVLQEHLLSWQAALPGNSSWLRPFWDDQYLAFRQSLPRNLHYTLQLQSEDWSPDALSRFTAAMTLCIQSIRRESIPVERSGGSYISMDTMGGMIYTRIPVPQRDLWYHPRLTAPLTAAVVCRGHWFILSLMDPEGAPLSPETLKDAYGRIRETAKALPAAVGVSAFTCGAREEAAEIRLALSHFMLNRLSLESIEKAAFVVCLNEEGAKDASFGRNVLGGEVRNRWFDKSFQLIADGDCLGASLEHSGCDGILWAYLFGQANEALHRHDCPYSRHPAPAHIRLLEWVVPEELSVRLRRLEQDFSVWNQSLLFDQRRMSALSKTALKALKCSPDAVVQLLFQATYHRLFGQLRSVYEAVSTRNFYEGRTECIRSCTAESKAFIQALDEGLDSETIRSRFRAAVSVHSENTARCKAGLGCERHISGLLAMHRMYYPQKPFPAIVETEGYRILTHDALSTSSIPGSAIDYFAFVPVVQDGLGLGYALYDSGLHVTVSSYAESGIAPSDFLQTLEDTGKELLELLLDP